MHILPVNYHQNLINYPQRNLMWLLNTVPTNPTKQISTFPEDFQETFTKLTNEITVILFTRRTLPNFSLQLLGSNANR